MLKYITLVFTGWILSIMGAIAGETEINQMMKPMAKILTPHGLGSATAVKVDSILGTYLVTNYHVVQSALDDIKVQFYGNDEEYVGYVHSVDPQNDIAVILTRHQADFVVQMGDPPELFDDVMCVGSPIGSPLAPSRGIITGVDVQIFGTRYMTRTDCKLAPGNSGGAMFVKQNGVWKYVGMPSMVATLPVGFGFRIPITFLGIAVRVEDIRNFLDQNGVLNLPMIQSAPR